MKNNQEINSKLSKQIHSLENKIKHPKLYNIRNFIMRNLIKCGISLNFIIPFLLTTTIFCNLIKDYNDPFVLDNITTKAKIETIDTSTGYHIENKSFNYDYTNSSIEHSTAWHINENNLYERTVTIYKINKNINLSKSEEFFSMTKEEIDNNLQIENIKTIYKKSLEESDEIYNSDAIVITTYVEDENEVSVSKETWLENSLYFILLEFFSLLTAYGIKSIGNTFFKINFKNKFENYDSVFKKITKKDLMIMKEILELKKQNLEMINSTNIIDDNIYPYNLIKIDSKVEEEDKKVLVLKKEKGGKN